MERHVSGPAAAMAHGPDAGGRADASTSAGERGALSGGRAGASTNAGERAALSRVPELGLMSYVYLEHTPEAMAEAIASHGIGLVQLDPRQAGLADAAGEIGLVRAREVRAAFEARGITIPVLSGYMNLLDPNVEKRERNARLMERMIALAPEFGAWAIATETGSLHPSNQWAYHPDNDSEAAWEALLATVDRLRRCAVEHGVTLLLEGYVNNVLATPKQAAKLMSQLGRDGLGLVMDPFNYMREEELEPELQPEAVARMFGDIAGQCRISHAKDTVYGPKGISTPRAGTGRMDWPLVARALVEHLPDAPLFLEHLKPEEAAETLAFVRGAIEGAAQ